MPSLAFFLVVVLGSGLALPAAGSILRGIVRDGRTGQPLADAVVALEDLGRRVQADAEGRYVVDGLSPGPHEVRVRLLGYVPRSLHAMVPAEGELALDVALEPRPVPLPQVDVRAPIAVAGLRADTPASDADLELPIAAVRQHPLAAEPDAFQALVGPDASLDPETPSGVHVDGGPAEQTAFQLDGFPVFHPHHAAGLVSAWNPDALASLRLWSAGAASMHPHALSGTIEGVTRPFTPELRGQGAVSTTQARLALDGPLGKGGAGFLLAGRMAMHDYFRPHDEVSYLGDDADDGLARLEAPIAGGRIELLGAATDNEIVAAADPDSTPSMAHHLFDWSSRTLGLSWSRQRQETGLRLATWTARGDIAAFWAGTTRGAQATSRIDDDGARVAWERRGERGSVRAALRFDNVRTRYRVVPDSTATATLDLAQDLPMFTLTAGGTGAVTSAIEVEAGGSLVLSDGDPYAGGVGRVSWRPHAAWTVTARARSAHQFVQSLRNAESVTAMILPVDLPVAGAMGTDVPVAHGFIAALEGEWRPHASVRLGADAFARTAQDLVLVAPRSGGPFATSGFVVGGFEARGVAIEAALRTARVGAALSLAFERIRFTHADSTYAPQYATDRRLQGGVIWSPAATTSLRVGVVAGSGRQATLTRGTFEWESCNLLDRGCEFAGRPDQGNDPLGGEALPSYLRVDLGARRHWHVEIGSREAVVALFATWSNVFDRTNLLTRLVKAEGTPEDIEMRPSGPFVLGFDARF